jgi:hypothetical protein
MVVNVGSGAKVSGIREGTEDSGGSGAGDGACVDLSEHHAGGFDKADRGVDG